MRKCYVTLALSGVPNEGEQNHKWLPHPCLLGGPKEGGNATSPLHSRGSPTKGNKITTGCLNPPFSGVQRRQKCEATPAFSWIPNAKHGEQNQKCFPTKGNKIKSGCLTPAFLGAQKRAEMLRHHCILKDPQHQAQGAKSEVVPNKGEQNHKWLPHPCHLGRGHLNAHHQSC